VTFVKDLWDFVDENDFQEVGRFNLLKLQRKSSAESRWEPGSIARIQGPPASDQSGAFRRVEQPPVLEYGVAIGHSGDVVRYRPGTTPHPSGFFG